MRYFTKFLSFLFLISFGWWAYLSISAHHSKLYFEAYSLGVDTTRKEYDRLLKIENSKLMLEAKCAKLDKEWIDEYNSRRFK